MKKLFSIIRIIAALILVIVICSALNNADSRQNYGEGIKDISNNVNAYPLSTLGDTKFNEVLNNELLPIAEPVEISSATFQVTVLPDGSFRLFDKISRAKYEPDPWGDGAGTITFEVPLKHTSQTLLLSRADKITSTVKGNTIEVTFSWKQGVEVLTRLALVADALTVSVENVTLPSGARLTQMVYPSRFAALTTGENGYLIIPSGPGAIIPSHLYTVIGGEFWRMDDAYRQRNPGGIYMDYLGQQLGFNFTGVQRGNSGLTFICDDPFDAGILIFANTRGNRYAYVNGKWSMKDPIAALSSVWLSSLGKFGYRRQLTIRRHGQGGYLESAALERRWLDEHGWSRTLKEKIKQNPEREKLIGSSQIDIYLGYPHYAPNAPKVLEASFDQITDIVDAIDRELKIDRAAIAVWGTFENYPPNCWPINKERGGLEAWKRTVDRAKKAGYLITGYHSYMPQEEQDPLFDPRLIFQSDPDNPDPLNRVVTTMRWRRTCTSFSLGYVQKNLTQELAATGQNADFIDIMGVFPGIECYDTVNHPHRKPLTRQAETTLRQNMYTFIHDKLNLPNWTENGSASYLKEVDGFGGLASFPDVLKEIAIPVPLAALVAHDMVILRQFNGDNYRDNRNQFAKRTLYDILDGNHQFICCKHGNSKGANRIS